MKDKKYTTFQCKIAREIWNKFKIKSLSENSPTYRETLIHLIEEYVEQDVL